MIEQNNASVNSMKPYYQYLTLSMKRAITRENSGVIVLYGSSFSLLNPVQIEQLNFILNLPGEIYGLLLELYSTKVNNKCP